MNERLILQRFLPKGADKVSVEEFHSKVLPSVSLKLIAVAGKPITPPLLKGLGTPSSSQYHLKMYL